MNPEYQSKFNIKQKNLAKKEFLEKVDYYEEEFTGLEKYFRCLKEQIQEFKKKANDIIPDIIETTFYINEVQTLVKKIIEEQNSEDL